MPRKSLKRPWTPEDTALLAKLLREGKSNNEIARKMSRSRAAVGQHVRRLTESERRPASGG